MALSTIDTSSISGLGYGFKNRLINGGMVFDQRNAGASVTPTSGQYLVDRFQAAITQASKFSAQQNAGSITPPTGFINYLGMTSLSAYSVGASDYFTVRQPIEGLNMADLGWGTSSASAVTLSFWVRSSLTGTHSGSIYNNDSSRSYPFTFTVSSANTWEQKTITITGDTTGTWLTTNGVGARVGWSLGTGSTYSGTAGSWASVFYIGATGATSVVGTSGATFYITGVQLEAGTVATSFDWRPYGTELALCQRYLPAVTFDTGTAGYSPVGAGFAYGTGQALITVPFQVKARTGPSGITVSNPTSFSVYNNIGSIISAISLTANAGSDSAGNISIVVSSGLTVGNVTLLVINNANARLLFTGCEL